MSRDLAHKFRVMRVVGWAALKGSIIGFFLLLLFIFISAFTAGFVALVGWVLWPLSILGASVEAYEEVKNE